MEPLLGIEDVETAQRLIAERREAGIDRYDEVHRGVYVVAPAPRSRHQRLVMRIGGALQGFAGGDASAGVNVGTDDDYRIPDVAVLADGSGDELWHRSGVLVVVEILSPQERPAVKIEHYRSFGVGVYIEVDPASSSVDITDLGSGLDLQDLRSRVEQALS